jgi:hypothetical protein
MIKITVTAHLEGVVVCGRILEESIVGVEHLFRKQIEPLPEITGTPLSIPVTYLLKKQAAGK